MQPFPAGRPCTLLAHTRGGCVHNGSSRGSDWGPQNLAGWRQNPADVTSPGYGMSVKSGKVSNAIDSSAPVGAVISSCCKACRDKLRHSLPMPTLSCSAFLLCAQVTPWTAAAPTAWELVNTLIITCTLHHAMLSRHTTQDPGIVGSTSGAELSSPAA